MNIWQYATGEPWAITAPALQTVLDIVTRKIGSAQESIEAIAAKVGSDLENTYKVTMRDGVAVIPVVGPLFRYANLFTRVSGATSYELLALDFVAALENPDVDSIMLAIDSPGGEVNGCSELAQLIYESRGSKPIIAYVSGDAASGAYWIASACDEIIVSSTSGLGSIGVVGIYKLDDDDNNATIEIVSSQSPHKRLDLTSDEDRSIIQTRIDSLADVFVGDVARNRDVEPQIIIDDYGGGDVFIGDNAVQKGLADRLGSFEKTLQELKVKSPAIERGFFIPKSNTTEESTVSQHEDKGEVTAALDIETLKNNEPELAASLVKEGREAGVKDGVALGRDDERKRISAILDSDATEGRESLARHFAFRTDMSAEAALAALEASPKKDISQPSAATSFEKVMAGIENPAIEPAADQEFSEEENINATALRIAESNK